MNSHIRDRFLVLMFTLCSGCSLIPIQAGRMDTVFNYTQTYELGGIRQADPTGQRLGPRLLTAVLGERNFCAISGKERARYLTSLFRDHSPWVVGGLANAVIAPSPWSTDGFVMEANGRYLIRDDRTLIATSEFYVAKQSVHDFKELFGDRRTEPASDDRDLRWIDLLVRQIVVPEIDPGSKRFVHESELVIRLYVMPLDRAGLFTIAPVKHEIGIMSPREPNSVYSVGCVEFDDPQDGRKVFDVRRRDSMLRVDDYAEMLQRAGIHQQNNAFHPSWYGQSCAASERRGPYRMSAERSAEEWSVDRNGEYFRRLFEDPMDACLTATLSTLKRLLTWSFRWLR